MPKRSTGPNNCRRSAIRNSISWRPTAGYPSVLKRTREQTNKQVEFLSKGQGFTVFLTRGGEAVPVLGKSMPKCTPLGPDRLSTTVKPKSEAAPPSVLRMKLVGVRRVPQVRALNKLSATANYFIGNDPQKWPTDAPTYEKVRFYRIYPGVDLVY